MAKKKAQVISEKDITSVNQSQPIAPAITPEAREDQAISMAYDLAIKRMQEGIATSQEIVHFLKLGTAKSKLEEKKLEHEITLMDAKASSIASTEDASAKAEEAMKAFKGYAGWSDQSDQEDEYEYDDEDY